MVKGEISGSAAVLAEKVVASQHIVPAKGYSVIRHPYIALQPNDRRDRIRGTDSTQNSTVCFGNELRFFEVNEQKGPGHRTDGDRAEVLVQNQYFVSHGLALNECYSFYEN